MSKQSGLDIDLGNLCSKDAFQWAKTTFGNRHQKQGAIALKVDGAFSNMLLFGDQRIGITSDGIGTKIELAERTGIYHTLGHDLVAMVVDDLATAGFEPTTLSNIIDVDKLDRQTINDLMRGLAEACNLAGAAISGGEIAELGQRIGGYGNGMHFNWCATAVGVLPAVLDQPLDGSKVAEGHAVVSLYSPGFRSNGFSLIRRSMQMLFGDDWHQAPYDAQRSWGEMLLTPCVIYSPLVQHFLQRGIDLKGAAHITGGGIADNFARALKANGLGAKLDQLFAPAEMMQRLQTLAKISDEAAYLYWNMGNGMLIVMPEEQVEKALGIATEYGYQAQLAGHITAQPHISLRVPHTGAWLEYPL